MARSARKGPFVEKNLLNKVSKMRNLGKKEAIKTWSRRSQIPPEFVGVTFSVHAGNKFIDVFVTESMVGHRLGEFAPTRTFRGHGAIVKRTMDKT
jgi:small subunit ribosomal protein S19